MVLSITLLIVMYTDWSSILLFFAVFEFIPLAFFLLGLKFTGLQEVALWMPKNFFDLMHTVNMSTFEPVWQTTDGLEKCLISGFAGIVIFGLVGLWRIRKKEV